MQRNAICDAVIASVTKSLRMAPQETCAASSPSVTDAVELPPMPQSLVNAPEARHAMLRGTRKVAVTTAAWQCPSACIHFAHAPVLVTCAQATLPENSVCSQVVDAQVTGHFNAHAQDAHACVDEGSGDNRSFIHLQFMDGERIAMFATRFQIHLAVLTVRSLKRASSELIKARWKTNICYILSKRASGDNRQHSSPHLPIFISSYEDAPRWMKLCHHSQKLWHSWPPQRQLMRQGQPLSQRWPPQRKLLRERQPLSHRRSKKQYPMRSYIGIICASSGDNREI
jgi:hypothetical protein